MRLIQPDATGVVVDPPAAADWSVARASTVDDADGHAHEHGAVRPRDHRHHALRGRQHPAAPGAVDGPPDRVHGGRPRRDAGRSSRRPASTPTRSSSPSTRRRPRARPPSSSPRRTPTGTPPSSTSRTSSAHPSAAASPAAATTAPRPSGSRSGRAASSKVVSETAGRADLDTDGDGDSDGADYPAALKITDGERAALAPLYEPGAQLWRVPINHFSEWDFNWGGGLPAGGRLPRLGPDGLPLPPGCPQPASSTIDCEDQRLREELPVPGTPYSLSYSSDWEPSPADRRMTVPLIEGSVPDGLALVRLQVTVAGQTIVRRFAGAGYTGNDNPPPVTPDLETTIDWDGLDADGDPVPIAKAHLTLFYYYDGVYGVADPDATFAAYDKAGASVFPARIGDGSRAGHGLRRRVGPRDRDGRPRADRARRLGPRRPPRLRRAERERPARRRHGPRQGRGPGRPPAHRRPVRDGRGPRRRRAAATSTSWPTDRSSTRASSTTGGSTGRSTASPPRSRAWPSPTPSSRSGATAAPPRRATSGTSRTSPRGRTAACSWPSRSSSAPRARAPASARSPPTAGS